MSGCVHGSATFPCPPGAGRHHGYSHFSARLYAGGCPRKPILPRTPHTPGLKERLQLHLRSASGAPLWHPPAIHSVSRATSSRPSGIPAAQGGAGSGFHCVPIATRLDLLSGHRGNAREKAATQSRPSHRLRFRPSPVPDCSMPTLPATTARQSGSGVSLSRRSQGNRASDTAFTGVPLRQAVGKLLLGISGLCGKSRSAVFLSSRARSRRLRATSRQSHFQGSPSQVMLLPRRISARGPACSRTRPAPPPDARSPG